MEKRCRWKKGLAFAFAITVVCLLHPTGNFAALAKTDIGMDEFEHKIGTYNIDDSIPDYKDYLEQYPDTEYSDKTITVGAKDCVRYEEDAQAATMTIYSDYEGKKGDSILTAENSLIEFEITVEESGWYQMSLTYYPVEGKNSDIERSIFLDGDLPYKELSIVTFPRIWHSVTEETKVNENGVTEKVWEKDNQGNDVKPKSEEIPEWQTRCVYDKNGYIETPLLIWLEKGIHTISIVSVKEPMLIHKITFETAEELAPYVQVKAEWDALGYKESTGKSIRIEAEYAAKTSSQMLYPQQDQASASVYPASAKQLLNNTIGGNSWRLVGQWIEWDFSVEESGYYTITLHDKQNYSRGVSVSRRITLDGKVPFEEFAAYGFSYGQDWKSDTLCDEDGTPYQIYLEKGMHTIRMEVVLGDFAEIIGLVEEAVQELNDIYRRVIRITGVSPDTYRDYQIEASLPELHDDLVAARDVLELAMEKLGELVGKNNQNMTVLLTMRDQLNDLIKDGDYFVRVLSSYKTNVRALGNWITSAISQPLALDSICISSPDTETAFKEAGFFKKLWHEIKRLYYSFVIDYNQIGSVSEKEDTAVLTLWIGSGRDQANVIKALIDETFTNETGISVNVQLVDMSTLLTATLVGEGPDVAIQVPNTTGSAGSVLYTGNDTPVNYGIRNAVYDLTQFSDLSEILERFPEETVVQFSYDGAVYALPETITFPVMFYRKDILAEIGLEVPETWDDVKTAMTVLAKNQMEFGMLPDEQLFASLLYQNGGSYYNEDGTASALDSDIAVDVFKIFCNYYTDYKLDRATSVAERFRTGECPIIITDYTTYNNFAVSAPDIAGLWSFTQIPGTKKEDGTVDHSVACTGLASIIMKNTEYPQEAWEFLKWWTSTETQTLYGREMESLMGAAARVPTANYEAFANMAWPSADFRALKNAMQWVKGIPQVPGGYYTWRNVKNAFYSVINNKHTASAREELMDNVIYINAEIAYKREELELDR